MGVELRPRPLTVADSERLITAATEHAPLRPHDAEALARRSGGNPLFLHGLLGAVGQSGTVDGLPDTIEAMVVAQIDRLGTAQRRLVRHASVLGLAFSTDLVAMLLDPDDDPPGRGAWDGLDELLAHDGPGQFRFRHALTRDAAYEALSYRRRRELHARAAAAIEQRRAGPDDDLDLLALHYLNAGDNRRAWDVARAAARAAEAEFAIGDASVNYGRALLAARHLGDLPAADRAETLEALGDLNERMGPVRRRADRFTEARAAAGGRPGGAGPPVPQAFDSGASAARAIPKRCVGCGAESRRWTGATISSRLASGRGCRRPTAWCRLAQGRRLEAVTVLEEAICEAQRSGEKDALAHAYLDPRLGALRARPRP